MTGSVLALGFTVLAYLVGAVLSGANVFLRRPALLWGGRSCALVGVLLHTAAIGLRCAELRHAPFTTPAESLSALAWMVALIYLAADLLWKLPTTGPFALSLSFLLVLGAGLTQEGRRLPSGAYDPMLLNSNAISLHIIAILAAYGAFSLAFCCAALYLITHRLLKSKSGLLWLRRLPPLTTVENAAFTLVAIGFPLLTLGIAAGLLRAHGLPSGWVTDAKTLLAFGVWGVYGIYLLGRTAANWPPIRTSTILLVGLALCLLLLFIPTVAHRFG